LQIAHPHRQPAGKQHLRCPASRPRLA
jgi:hypothetical protein